MNTPMYRGRSRDIHRRAVAAVERLNVRRAGRLVALSDLVDRGLEKLLDEMDRKEKAGKRFVLSVPARRTMQAQSARRSP